MLSEGRAIFQGKSVTDLTTALEGLRDSTSSKEFNGDLAKKLHIAEKHIRKNKLKVCPTLPSGTSCGVF